MPPNFIPVVKTDDHVPQSCISDPPQLQPAHNLVNQTTFHVDRISAHWFVVGQENSKALTFKVEKQVTQKGS